MDWGWNPGFFDAGALVWAVPDEARLVVWRYRSAGLSRHIRRAQHYPALSDSDLFVGPGKPAPDAARSRSRTLNRGVGGCTGSVPDRLLGELRTGALGKPTPRAAIERDSRGGTAKARDLAVRVGLDASGRAADYRYRICVGVLDTGRRRRCSAPHRLERRRRPV